MMRDELKGEGEEMEICAPGLVQEARSHQDSGFHDNVSPIGRGGSRALWKDKGEVCVEEAAQGIGD
jgi:hypothetical protein